MSKEKIKEILLMSIREINKFTQIFFNLQLMATIIVIL